MVIPNSTSLQVTETESVPFSSSLQRFFVSDRKTIDSVLQAMNMLGEKQDHKAEVFEMTQSIKKEVWAWTDISASILTITQSDPQADRQ